jgi:glycosylphosphatidylinositol transamidase (GPIT) subunit GPI8
MLCCHAVINFTSKIVVTQHAHYLMMIIIIVIFGMHGKKTKNYSIFLKKKKYNYNVYYDVARVMLTVKAPARSEGLR